MMNDRPAIVLSALDNVYFVATARPVKTARSVFRLP